MIRLALLAVGLGALLLIGLMLYVTVREKNVPAANPEDTQAMIVLGAQVKADGSLSVQLQWRLDKALEMYGVHPQPMVVCGSKGTDEPVAEARAMHDYLIANGVPESDILMDESSFNTRENLANARRLLPEEVSRVLIVTSDYHLPRALALAADTGFDASGVGSPIKAEYWLKNHFREGLAWVKYWLQGWGILS